MKVSKEAKRKAVEQARLFAKGKIPFCESAEAIQILDNLVEERKENINFALKKLGFKKFLS